MTTTAAIIAADDRRDARRRRLWALQVKLAPYLFVAPFVLLFATFLAYPLGRSLVMSVHRTRGGRQVWNGLGHYAFLAQDRIMWAAVLNTIGYTVGILLVQVPLSLALAVLLNSKRVWCRDAFRFAFFSPFLVGQVFVALIFALMLSNNGPLNAAVRVAVPGAELNWMTSPYLARPAVVIAALWLGVGFGMIYCLAALQGVDRELYEAAEVDGANKWSQFLNVTLPGIRPVLSFLILSGTIGGLQMFELPYVLFNGPGPGGAGLTVVAYLFSWVEVGDLNTAAAVGWMLAAGVICVALFQIRSMRASFEE